MPTVIVDGLKVDYEDTGTGLPIVFVPGLFGSTDWFRYQVFGLSSRYRILSYNLRTARGRVEYSMDLLSRDLVRILDRLRIHGAVIVGHTFGAMVAMQFAAENPERALAVGIISSAPSFSDLNEDDILAHLSPGEVESESLFARLWKRVMGNKLALEDDSDPLKYLARHGGTVDRATLAARLRLMREADAESMLAKIEAPMIVIAGADDWSAILSGSETIHQEAADSTLEVLENTDHFCFFKRHDLVNAVLDDFVSREVPRL